MNINVLAIDDEPLALQQLAAYIEKVPFLRLVARCQSAMEAREVMEREAVDAIFCDINMPDLSGMDFVRQLPVRPLVVFTTAYSDYAVEGYKVDAVDYLLKPFGLTDLQRAALKLKSRLAPAEQGTSSFFVKTDYRTVRVEVADIRYVEGMSEYLKLHLDSQPKPLITLLSMKKIEEFLPRNFMRIHRSYIVNMDKVSEVGKNRVVLDADTTLPIGENYKEQFLQYIDNRFLGK